MSRKIPILIVSVCILILSMVVASIPIASLSPAATKLSISPASITGNYTGESFTVDINIENVVNLTGFSIGLKWDPTVLQCLSWTWQFGTGTFLGPIGDWIGIPGTIDNANGRIYPPGSYAWIGAGDGPGGSGTLVKATFNVTDYGFTWINLTDVFIESGRTIISVDLNNATFALFTVPPAAPVASFTYSPSAPKANQTVTFDASASTSGWNGTADVPIANYTWDFGDGNVTIVTTPIIHHTYTANDTYTVNLTVTCEYDSVLIFYGLTSGSTWQDVTVTGPVHDVAVTSVTPSPTEITAGENVTVTVTVKNEGDFTENFTVTAYYDNTAIDTPQTVTNLASGATETLNFTWWWYFTTLVRARDYTIKAVASTVAGETDTADNTYVDGTVTVTTPPGAPKVFISPERIIGPPPGIGENFTVDINIENVVNLTGFSVGIAWNASVLNCTGWTTPFGPGTFLGPSTDWIGIEGTINNTIGKVYPPYSYALLPLATPPSGNGTLAQVNFTVLDYGFTWINFSTGDTIPIIIESNKRPVPVDVTDGTVEIFAISPAAPVASFTYSPSAPQVDQTVTFNASASTPGWNGTDNVPIANYTWDFDDGNVTIVTTPIIHHTYTANDTYTVNLTVTCEYDSVLADLGLLSDSTWQDVTVTVVPVVLVHDVAVTSVTPSPTEVTAGENVTVTVKVKNEGDFTETFTVTAYYDNTVIGTQSVTNLASGATETLTFTWDTTDVDEGNYTIKAVASTVTGETDTADNTLVDGTVTVTVPAPAPEIPWLWITPAIIIIVVIAIIAYMVIRRRKAE